MGPVTPGGSVFGCASVQVRSAPFQSHVSPRYSDPLYPPKRTSWAVGSSKANIAAARGGGEMSGFCCAQLVPSKVHVSLRYVEPSKPPNRTIWLLTGSSPIAKAARGEGD